MSEIAIGLVTGLIVALGFVSFTIIVMIIGISVGKMIVDEIHKKGE